MNFDPRHYLSHRDWWPTTQPPLTQLWLIRGLVTLLVVLALIAGYCYVSWQTEQRRSQTFRERWQQTRAELETLRQLKSGLSNQPTLQSELDAQRQPR
jgi:uncharacterized protein HemX